MGDRGLADPPLPTHVGRYEVIRSLGTGGMARVYLAVQRGPVAAKLVVVKCLRPEFAQDPVFVDMFGDEARVALLMNHPNVIHAYEATLEDGEYFIAMEFLEGKTLEQLLRALAPAKLPLELHLWILCEVLGGLSYAHELCDFDGTSLEIVHRDVSPSNVFLTRTGAVKLVDFGIAKFSGGASETQHDRLRGRIGYAAPEQCLDEPVDARSDLYSVGVMLWEAIAGRPRAAGDTAMATVQARILDMEPDIVDVCPDVAPELAEIVRRALAFEPTERYPTAEVFRGALRQYLAESGGARGEHALAALLVEHFSDEMTQLRRLIDGSVRLTVPPSLPPSSRQGAAGQVGGAPALRSPTSGAPVAVLASSPSVLFGKPRSLVVVGVVALTALSLVLFLLAQRSGAGSNPARSAPATLAFSGTPAPTTAAPSANSAPAKLPRQEAAPPLASSFAVAHAKPARSQPKAQGVAVRGQAAGTGATALEPAPAKPANLAAPVEPGVDLRKQKPPLGGSTQQRALDERDPYPAH